MAEVAGDAFARIRGVEFRMDIWTIDRWSGGPVDRWTGGPVSR